MKILFLWFAAIFLIPVYGQRKCQQLSQASSKANSDTAKIRMYIETGNCYYLAFETDSARNYYELALHLFNEKETNFSGNKNVYSYKSVILRKLGDIEFDVGQYDAANNLYRQSLNNAQKWNILNEVSTCYNNIAILYHKQGMFDSAIFYYFNALKIDEQLNDLKGIASRYNNIGNVYYAQQSFNKALEYYQKSYEIKVKLKDTSGISFSYLNIGAVLLAQKKFNEAINYFNKSLELKKKLNDVQGVILLYNNLGLIYRNLKQYQKALDYYTSALDLAKDLNDKYKMAMLYENMASVYHFFGNDLQNVKDFKKAKVLYEKAIEYSKQSLALSSELKSFEYMHSSTSTIYRTYFALGEYKKGIAYLEQFLQIKDSLFSRNKTKAIAEAEQKFEAEKKQLVIDNLTKEKQLQNSELKRQQTIIWSVIVGLIMSVFFAFFMVQRFRITKRQKLIIEKQKIIVDEKNLLLNKQNEEIKAQHEIVVRQKEHIEEIHKKLTDSINYAKRIQEAILPDKAVMNRILGDYFVLFKPKDIVSGDFYWTTQINEWLIISVADCTGHGVPGAFMSMLGISFLNEIVHKKEVTKASQVLDLLRDEIVQALRQKSISVEQKDGMDISLFVMNTQTRQCQWAGANNPLIVLKQNSAENQWQLYEFKPDKMPLAIYPRMEPFTNHEFTLEQGTRIYLFSDGFADQFSYQNGKKFMHKRFKNLLLHTAHFSLKAQQSILDDTIEQWKGPLEQTDDITVVAVQL